MPKSQWDPSQLISISINELPEMRVLEEFHHSLYLYYRSINQSISFGVTLHYMLD